MPKHKGPGAGGPAKKPTLAERIAEAKKEVASLKRRLLAAEARLAKLEAEAAPPPPKPKPKPLRKRLVAVARKELGAREWPAGSNRGKEVEKYLASVGLPGGYPWCTAFVVWCLKECGFDGPWPANKAWCPSWVSFVDARKLRRSFVAARLGDLVLFDWERDGNADHIGIVVRNLGLAKNVATLEGNAGDHGGEVAYHWRAWWNVLRIVDTDKLEKLGK